MFEQQKFYDTMLTANDLGSALGAAMLRDVLLPQLIGEDNTMLYWGGKKLARQFVLAKDELIAPFFAQVGWGKLVRTKAKRNQQMFELSGAEVHVRLNNSTKPDFLLEAGFLAETIQAQLGFVTEAIVAKTDAKKGVVTLLVQVDTKDPIDLAPTNAPTPLSLSFPQTANFDATADTDALADDDHQN